MAIPTAITTALKSLVFVAFAIPISFGLGLMILKKYELGRFRELLRLAVLLAAGIGWFLYITR